MYSDQSDSNIGKNNRYKSLWCSYRECGIEMRQIFLNHYQIMRPGDECGDNSKHGDKW